MEVTRRTKNNTVAAKTVQVIGRSPEGDSMISEGALNNFVFFVYFVVRLPNSGSSVPLSFTSLGGWRRSMDTQRFYR